MNFPKKPFYFRINSILLMATRNPARKPVEVKVVFYHNLQGFSTIQPRVNHQQYFSKRHLNYKMDPGSSYELNGFFSSPRVLGTPTKAINPKPLRPWTSLGSPNALGEAGDASLLGVCWAAGDVPTVASSFGAMNCPKIWLKVEPTRLKNMS